MKHSIISAILATVFFASAACTTKEADTTLSMKKTEPPFTKITPTGLKGSSSSRTLPSLARSTENCLDCPSPVTVIKERFFDAGPTQVREILKQIDSRVGELATRSVERADEGIETDCLKQTPTDFALSELPAGESFTLKLLCEETISDYPTDANISSFKIFVGTEGTTGYLSESIISSSTDGMSRFISIDDSENMESWLMSTKMDTVSPEDATLVQKGFMMHLISRPSEGIVEFSVAGNTNNVGIGMSCGAQYRSNASYIYVKGQFNDVSVAGYCDDLENNPVLEVCVDGSTLTEVDLTNCTNAGLNNLTLNALSITTVGAKNIVTATQQRPTGLMAWEVVDELNNGLGL